MSLKKGAGPALLPTTLTITGQGSTDKLKVTYHNRRTSDVNERMAEAGMSLAGMVPYLVESWDTDFALTQEGVEAFEDEYPGMLEALLAGFWKARRKETEKN
jgi:hypothetical protein